MHGKTSAARQDSAGGHARHVEATQRAAPLVQRRSPHWPAQRCGEDSAIRGIAGIIAGLASGHCGASLELGAFPGAVPCARLHARQMLWEWRLTGLSDIAELLISELVTNAVQISCADAQTHTGTTMDDGRPDAGPDPGVGLQPATSGAQEYQPGRRERPWPAAGGNPQYAVGLVLPAATQRRQGGLGANGDVVIVNTATAARYVLAAVRLLSVQSAARGAQQPSLYGIMHAATSAAGHAIGNRFKITTSEDADTAQHADESRQNVAAPRGRRSADPECPAAGDVHSASQPSI